MGKKLIRSAGITIVVLLFILAAAYLGLSIYYRDGFSYGTWINGVYCTGKTVDEVNEELLQSCTYDGLEISDKEGDSYWLEADRIGYSFDFKEALQVWLKRQNPYLWIDHLWKATEKNLVPVISYDNGELQEVLDRIPFFSDGLTEAERKVTISKTDRGYILVNEREGVLDKEAAAAAVKDALNRFEGDLDLKASGCYGNLPLDASMKETLALWEKISTFQDCHIIYQFGEEQVPVDASVVCDWIALEKDGSFRLEQDGSLIADEDKMEEFVEKLADEYDSVGTLRHFKSTRGEMVAVEGGTYGNRLDRKAEKAYLKQAFQNKVTELHTPEYIQKAWKQGKNDIGKTYIEIDMTKQMMYYYEDGKLKLDTPVVTGNTGRRMGTPTGVNYVYAKQENRVLRGPGYASHVNYWMPVKGNIGIHDASWRSEYGGEIYKTGGSHGCINTPYDAMSELFGIVQTGTPVVMFY